MLLLFEECKPVRGGLRPPTVSRMFCLAGSHDVVFGYIIKTKRIIVTLIAAHTSVGRDKTCSCQTVHSQRGWGRGVGWFWRDAGAGHWMSPTSFQPLVSLNNFLFIFFKASFVLIGVALQGLTAKTTAWEPSVRNKKTKKKNPPSIFLSSLCVWWQM